MERVVTRCCRNHRDNEGPRASAGRGTVAGPRRTEAARESPWSRSKATFGRSQWE